MIKVVDTKWHPYIAMDLCDGGKLYYDIMQRSVIVQNDGYTAITIDNTEYYAKDTAEDIFKAIDKLIEDEQDKKAQQAKEYMAATMARVAETAERVGDK